MYTFGSTGETMATNMRFFLILLLKTSYCLLFHQCHQKCTFLAMCCNTFRLFVALFHPIRKKVTWKHQLWHMRRKKTLGWVNLWTKAQRAGATQKFLWPFLGDPKYGIWTHGVPHVCSLMDGLIHKHFI